MNTLVRALNRLTASAKKVTTAKAFDFSKDLNTKYGYVAPKNSVDAAGARKYDKLMEKILTEHGVKFSKVDIGDMMAIKVGKFKVCFDRTGYYVLDDQYLELDQVDLHTALKAMFGREKSTASPAKKSVAKMDAWAEEMTKILKTVLKKVDTGLSGMGSEDGYTVESDSVVYKILEAFRKNYKIVQGRDWHSIKFGDGSKGIHIEAIDDGEWSLTWYDNKLGAAADALPAAKVTTEAWAKSMIDILKQVDGKVKTGLDGMASHDGYDMDHKKVTKLMRLFPSAGYMINSVGADGDGDFRVSHHKHPSKGIAFDDLADGSWGVRWYT